MTRQHHPTNVVIRRFKRQVNVVIVHVRAACTFLVLLQANEPAPVLGVQIALAGIDFRLLERTLSDKNNDSLFHFVEIN